jgi:hypothetical protein
VLSVALDIQGLIQAGGVPAEDTLRTILGRTAPRGEEALGAIIALLLARLPGAGLIMTLGAEAAGSNTSKTIDTAVESAIDRIQAALDSDTATGVTMAMATADASHVAELLEDVARGSSGRPERKRKADRVRRAADMKCRSRFEIAMQDEFLAKIEALSGDPPDDVVEDLEMTARELRRLDAYGRMLGGGDRYDGLLQLCFDVLKRPTTALRPNDRARLVEILLGPRQALTLLP